MLKSTQQTQIKLVAGVLDRSVPDLVRGMVERFLVEEKNRIDAYFRTAIDELGITLEAARGKIDHDPKSLQTEAKSPLAGVDYPSNTRLVINRMRLSVAEYERIQLLALFEGKTVTNVVGRIVILDLEKYYTGEYLPQIKFHADRVRITVEDLEDLVRDGEKIPQPEK
ncbi:hypothetical protein ACQ4M3_39535 [Leptolyngbya sp. AN03gr2]|uniref:hypothetical protein n=1 Tax=unclassified Leptolyngbya TaxID=2650499 RepID=UPI003D317675